MANSGNVYVVQHHLRYDPDLGELVPRYNLQPAERWGKLRFILDSRATVQRPEAVIAKMDLVLQGFTDDDYLLPIGNPVLIGWAMALAAANNEGKVAVLVWSSRDQRYTPAKSRLPIAHLGV